MLRSPQPYLVGPGITYADEGPCISLKGFGRSRMVVVVTGIGYCPSFQTMDSVQNFSQARYMWEPVWLSRYSDKLRT